MGNILMAGALMTPSGYEQDPGCCQARLVGLTMSGMGTLLGTEFGRNRKRQNQAWISSPLLLLPFARTNINKRRRRPCSVPRLESEPRISMVLGNHRHSLGHWLPGTSLFTITVYTGFEYLTMGIVDAKALTKRIVVSNFKSEINCNGIMAATYTAIKSHGDDRKG